MSAETHIPVESLEQTTGLLESLESDELRKLGEEERAELEAALEENNVQAHAAVAEFKADIGALRAIEDKLSDLPAFDEFKAFLGS